MTIAPGASASTGPALLGLESLLSPALLFSSTYGMANGSYWRLTGFPWAHSKPRSIRNAAGLFTRQFQEKQGKLT